MVYINNFTNIYKIKEKLYKTHVYFSTNTQLQYLFCCKIVNIVLIFFYLKITIGKKSSAAAA